MTKTFIIGAAVILVGWAGFAMLSPKSVDDAMMQDDTTMAVPAGDAMMQDEGDAMMQDGAAY